MTPGGCPRAGAVSTLQGTGLLHSNRGAQQVAGQVCSGRKSWLKWDRAAKASVHCPHGRRFCWLALGNRVVSLCFTSRAWEFIHKPR